MRPRRLLPRLEVLREMMPAACAGTHGVVPVPCTPEAKLVRTVGLMPSRGVTSQCRNVAALDTSAWNLLVAPAFWVAATRSLPTSPAFDEGARKCITLAKCASPDWYAKTPWNTSGMTGNGAMDRGYLPCAIAPPQCVPRRCDMDSHKCWSRHILDKSVHWGWAGNTRAAARESDTTGDKPPERRDTTTTPQDAEASVSSPWMAIRTCGEAARLEVALTFCATSDRSDLALADPIGNNLVVTELA